MDTIIENPQNGARSGLQDISIIDTANWSNSNQNGNNNSTLLYIAVEYVKDYKMYNPPSNLPIQSDSYSDFDQHVSPLDPNMSCVARYSPVYNEPTTTPATNSDFNPVIIHQLVSSEEQAAQNDQYVNLNQTPLDSIPTVLCNNDLRDMDGQYLRMVEPSDNEIVNGGNERLTSGREQPVELLITDQATGISYSVNAQEFLVERCLEDDHQLLESLAPDPLLESDLLTLDENTLKHELNDEIDLSSMNVATVQEAIVNSYDNNYHNNMDSTKNLDTISPYSIETRKRTRTEMNEEEQLLSCVYTIADKPILSRARASLPESYLVIGKVDEECAVFAKKAVPRRTQFGPLEGVISVQEDNLKENNNGSLRFLIKTDDKIYEIDVGDENSSNWMRFVRRAENFEEQNLVITQENSGIYFTSICDILPKQELKVGYSASYAHLFNFEVLQPKQELTWHCFECPSKFLTSEELQKHLAVHDDVKDDGGKLRKKAIKKVIKKYQSESIECNLCKEIFPQYNYNSLKAHIIKKHKMPKENVEQHFSKVMHYRCDSCSAEFRSEALLKIHNLEHDPDSSDEQLNHVCPACQRKFPTQRQLVTHVMQHRLPKKCEKSVEKPKCPVCYKVFALKERLQKHMLVHGSEESKPLQCKTCGKRFLNSSALSCHTKTHFVGKEVFECPICKESFDHVLKLKLHVPKHCHNNTFTCPHCKKIFKKYSIIRKHIRAFHCERTHECQQCTKVFPTFDKLKLHLLRHSDHREFLCADCGKQFKRKDKLNEHCKRIHNEERENTIPDQCGKKSSRKHAPKVEPTDFYRFIYKCHSCLVGFKRRGMLVNHLAKRHPDIRPDSVPELNLPILQTTRDYYCQYCDKVYKSSSKRKAHILKNHPGAALPMSNRKQSSLQEVAGLPNPTYSQTVGSVTTIPQSCKWCHKQYASKTKLLQHQRKKHPEQLANEGELNKMEKVQKTEKIKNDGMVENNVVADFDKVEVGNIMTNELEDYNLGEDSQLCHLAINENGGFIETDLENPNSHLYRLLTTSNDGMIPPR